MTEKHPAESMDKTLSTKDVPSLQDPMHPPHHDPELSAQLPVIVDLGKEPPNIKYLKVVFFFQGIALLFAFNALMNSSAFFASRSEHYEIGHLVMDYFMITFALVRFIFMIITPIYLRGTSPYKQVMISQTGNVFVFVAFAFLIYWEELDSVAFFWLSTVIVIFLSAFSVVAFVGIFTIIAHIPDSDQFASCIATGQGVAGTVVTLVKIISLCIVDLNKEHSTFVFFLFSAALLLLSVLIFIPVRNIRRSEGMLMLVPQAKLRAKHDSADGDGDGNDGFGVHATINRAPKASGPWSIMLGYYFSLYREIRLYFWCIFLLFFQTMLLVPTFLYLTQSTNYENGDFFHTKVFVVFSLFLFNVGDWLGRSLVSVGRFSITNRYVVFGLCMLRFAFVPLYLLGNVHLEKWAYPIPRYLAYDAVYCTLNALLGFTAGYLVTVIMEHAPETVENKHDRRYAMLLMMHCMTFALFMGAVASLGLELVLYALSDVMEE